MDNKIWMVFGGIGLFLYGMILMEKALGQLAGRNFKLLLRRNTATNFRAVLSGTVITALLQSSSIVSFLTLAFAGSGIIKLQQAYAVILGSNIGTTLSNWIIVTLGFGFEIDLLWYPLLGIAGIALLIFQGKKRIEQFSLFFLGITFLFIALSFMKNGMAATVERFDITRFSGYPPVVFVIIGFIITFLIQSSTATVAITLSALYAGAIPFSSAVSIVIGSELGTSLKLVFASASGSPEKKRLAAGNILLNFAVTLLALGFLPALIKLVTVALHIQDPMQGLVAFQMIINVAASILFFPFLGPLSRWLEKRFKEKGDRASFYINQQPPSIPGLAQEIFRLEVFYFLKRVLAFNAAEFKLSGEQIGLNRVFTESEWKKESRHNHLHDRYDEIKQSQGEIIAFYVQMLKEMSNAEELQTVHQQIRAVQNAMHAAKGFKDIHHNRNELLQSGNDLKFGQFALFSNIIQRTLKELTQVFLIAENSQISAHLIRMLAAIQKDYEDLLQEIYAKANRSSLPEKDISTLQNMNRELYSANKAMIYALADFMLKNEEAEGLKNAPIALQ